VNDDRRETLLDLLLGKPAPAEWDTLSRWLAVWRGTSSSHARFGPYVAAIAAALRADRMAGAFFSGYQGAIQAGFAGGRVNADGRAAAFCANEAGRKLTEITTSLHGSARAWRLQGRKSWMLAGIDDLDLFVLVRNASGPASGPGSLSIVRVPREGVGVEPGEPRRQGVVPELPHCEVTFNDVPVASEQVLEGDGYRDHARPFRLREDIFVTGCTLAFLLAQGHLAGWPTPWRQRCIAVVVTLGECAALSATDTRTEVFTAGTLALAGEVIEAADRLWADHESPAGERWRRDKPILGGGKEARRQRAVAAWARAGWPGSVL
jgi:acyl-CoA dehydrogenase